MKLVSILRGINVSGQKKINMLELKSLYESLKLKGVTTYIQSGNIIYETKEKSRNKLIKNQEQAIEKKYQFHVPVDIRSHNEIKDIVQRCPFNDVEIENNLTKILVTFLNNQPTNDSVSKLMAQVKTPERLFIDSKNVYVYCPNGYGKSKLTNQFIEKKLEVSATTRNWKTVLKLLYLSS